MKAVIIEDETAAVTSLRAMLTENQVVQVDVIAELESVPTDQIFRTTKHQLYAMIEPLTDR